MVETINWPGWMKYPLVDGYGVEPADRRIVTEMEVGSITRVEFDTDETSVSCSLFLDALGSNWFEAFERDFLRQGSKWFKWKLWIGGRLTEQTVRFKDRPKLTEKSGQYCTYTFTLDLGKREGLMPTELVEILTYLDPKEFMASAELLQKTVNVDLPESLPFAA